MTQKPSGRFASILETIVRMRGAGGERTLQIADVGCGDGAQCQLWAERGHRAHGVDVDEQLVEQARRKATAAGFDIEFYVGSAGALPWPDESMDVCLVISLLEHIPDWETCLDECARILRAGGVLYLVTTNVLCPSQQEFRLPLYSWYPDQLKRYFERLSVTSRPDLINYSRYPAVNWFSFYQFREALGKRGLTAMHRFDVASVEGKGHVKRVVLRMIRRSRVLRWLGQVTTPSTRVLAFKTAAGSSSYSPSLGSRR